MANLNKVMLIGRLTRDPEIKEFEGGGRVTSMGFAVHNRRRNPDTGQWGEVPVWLNLKAFNRAHGQRLADLSAKLHKGRQIYVEGHLALEQWTGKEDGRPHSKTLVYVDAIQFMGGGARHPAAAQADEQGGEQLTEKDGDRGAKASAESGGTGADAGPDLETAQTDAPEQPGKPAKARRKNH